VLDIWGERIKKKAKKKPWRNFRQGWSFYELIGRIRIDGDADLFSRKRIQGQRIDQAVSKLFGVQF
jgi:hypothetical protein